MGFEDQTYCATVPTTCPRQFSMGECCPLCQQYLSLEDEVLSAKKAIEEAQNKQRQLLTKMNQIHDPITNRLPSEIVAQIFQSTLTRKSEAGEMGSSRIYNIDSPLFLGAVCRSWREIVWSSPSLWNWIHICFYSIRLQRNMDDLVAEWLGRSGELPLTIYISCAEDIEYNPAGWICQEFFQNLVYHINQRSARWSDVCFKCPSTWVSRLNGCKQGAPNLQVLALEPTDSLDENFDFVMNGPTPQPSYLSIPHFFKTLPERNLGCERITRLYVRGLSTLDCIDIIENSPNLFQCVFCMVKDNEHSRSSLVQRAHFVHQGLRVFGFFGVASDEDRALFFEKVTFPRLADVNIQYYFQVGLGSGYLAWSNSIGPFITRSCRQTTSLALKVPCQSSSFAEVLAATPLLRKLELGRCFQLHDNGHSGFIGLLAHLAKAFLGGNEQRGPILPNLEDFTYLGSWGEQPEANLPWMEMLDLVGPLAKMRNPQRHPLDNLILNIDSRELYDNLSFDFLEHLGVASSKVDWQTILDDLPLSRLDSDSYVHVLMYYSPFLCG